MPEGVQNGKVFRLRGKGIKGVRSGTPGDLYVHMQVETPVRLTDKQKQMLRELDQSLDGGPPQPADAQLEGPGQGVPVPVVTGQEFLFQEFLFQ